jgi:hypothetical protein
MLCYVGYCWILLGDKFSVFFRVHQFWAMIPETGALQLCVEPGHAGALTLLHCVLSGFTPENMNP